MANSQRCLTDYQTTTISLSNEYRRRTAGQVPALPPKHGWRELMGVVAVIGCLAFGMIAAMAGWNAGDVPAHVRTVTYTVRGGDTAWSIASRDKQYSTGALVQWLTDRYGTDLQPGQIIQIPIGGR